MTKHKQGWQTREKNFAAFASGPLLEFWHRREERQFSGVDGLAIHYVRFTHPRHNQIILLVPGRIESYRKYTEVAWDLFHSGYDVIIIDHRGQGRSGRLLKDTQRGHVTEFRHYVDDLATLWQQEIAVPRYKHRYALAHSMGAAILTLLLTRQPGSFDAVALLSPMFGICLPLPLWMAQRLLNWTEERPAIREAYALGTGKWQPRPFINNPLTHSRVRYLHCLRLYADEPAICVGGPTYHWLREALQAGQTVLSNVAAIKTPVLLLQAAEDRVVKNHSQHLFCRAMAQAGSLCQGGQPYIIAGARHEILFETDDLRTVALNAITTFFIKNGALPYRNMMSDNAG